MSLDLFGNDDAAAPRMAAGELFVGLAPGLACEVARLREAWQRASSDARRNPGSDARKRAAATAERAYLALRDHKRGMSGAEVRASMVSEGRAAPLPADNLSAL